ncbi:hypothetical protein D3C73_1376280 [compost metagenome]
MRSRTGLTASGFLEPTLMMATARKMAKISRGTTLPVAASLTGLDGTRSSITSEKVGISRAVKPSGTAC